MIVLMLPVQRVVSVFLESLTEVESLKDEQVSGGAGDRSVYASDAHGLGELFNTTSVISLNRRKLNAY